MNEPLVTDINFLVDDLFARIKATAHNERYALYGHSLGGLIAGLLARKIVANRYVTPVHVFITGTCGPSASVRSEKKRHLLEKGEFIEEIRRLNGSPEEILQNDELLNYYEPILRADFAVSETYRHQESDPVEIPFTVITGTEEDMSEADVRLWQKETTVPVDFRRFPGNHFFIFKYPDKIIEVLSRKLMQLNHMQYGW